MSSKQTYQWHPSIHERWAGEKLSFWLLGFSPIYDRDPIVDGIRRALALHRATAYTIYELAAGGDDIFLRVWLAGSLEAFQTTLYATMAERGFQVTPEPFYVDNIIAHWPWEMESNALEIRPLSADAPHAPFHNDAIANINSGAISRNQRAEYQQANLITPAKRTKGIKFFTIISQHQALPLGPKQKLEARIKQVLHDAACIREKSLYVGLGLGEYLLMGRTPDYFAIEREITVPLNASVDFSSYGARTMTYHCSREDFLDARYDLKVEGNHKPPRSAIDVLEGGESHTVEVKGSAFVNLGRWLKGDHKVVRDDRISDEGFLKAVTGLLNADGGTLLIGALEQRDDDTKLAETPRIGEFILVGIDLDIGDAGWDRYERDLRELLSSRVRPDPNAWVSIRSELVRERLVAVVELHPGKRGFHHFPKANGHSHFWTRQGNRTIGLEGPDVQDYLRDK
jgi:hypothetical protein